MKIKMMKMIAVGLLAVFTTSVSHAIFLVTDPNDLMADTYTVHDFEAGASGAGATYSSGSGVVSASSGSYAGGGTPSGDFGMTTNSFPELISIVFDQAATAGGLWFGNDDTCCSGPFTAWLDLFDANGLVDSLGVVANMNDFADQFIGWNGTALITSMNIRYGDGSDVGLFTYIDDVTFNVGSVAVSEPGTLALLGLGLFGVALARRRKA